MAEFDPSTANVDEVLKKLEKASDLERQRILTAERGGKARRSILEEYGIDPDQRADGAGRVLYPWEVAPEDHVVPVQVDETDEARAAREAQAEFDAKVAAAAESNTPGGDEQQGATAPGVGVVGSPAPGAAAGGATTTTTATPGPTGL